MTRETAPALLVPLQTGAGNCNRGLHVFSFLTQRFDSSPAPKGVLEVTPEGVNTSLSAPEAGQLTESDLRLQKEQAKIKGS